MSDPFDMIWAAASPEEWRPVEDLGGLYEVSNLGGFRSLRTDPPSIVQSRPNPDGYLIVTVSIAGKRHTRKVHRMVCRAFNGPPNILHREAAHLDGNRANARAENLKWVSHRENMSHKFRHGTHCAGERHPRAKLSTNDVVTILARLAGGESYADLAAAFKVSYRTIEGIRRGRAWRHIKGPDAAYAPHWGTLRGASNPQAKLTQQQAAEMRARRAAGEHPLALARDYGLSRATAYKCLSGATYRDDQAQGRGA